MSWNPFNWVGLTSDGRSVDDLQREQDSISAREAELNQRRRDSGYYTDEEYMRAEQVRVTGAVDVSSEVGQAAQEGAVEGLKNLPAQVRGALNTSFGWSLSFIPWWGWVALLGVGFWYLGGFVYLRGILARR